jgi:hypothetical protein
MTVAITVRRALRVAVGAVLAAPILFALALCAGVITPGVDVRRETTAVAPDGRTIAEVWTAFGWLDATQYVRIRRVGAPADDKDVVVLDYWGRPGLLLRWRSANELDVGVPVRSTPQVRMSEKDGVRIGIVVYPDQPLVHDEFVRLHSESQGKDLIDPISTRFAKFDALARAPEVIFTQERTAAYRRTVDPVEYRLSTPQDGPDGRRCALGFAADGGPVAGRIEASLQAEIGTTKFVSFLLVLAVRGIRDEKLSRMTATGAQMIGDGIATVMIDGVPFPQNENHAENAFALYLDHQRELEGALKALTNPPYDLVFLWDLPDTAAVFTVENPPTPEYLSTFFECVGDAIPSHLAGEEFKQFYRSAQ